MALTVRQQSNRDAPHRIAHHESIRHLPLEARRDDIRTVLGFMAPAAAAWVSDTARIDDVLPRRPQGAAQGSGPSREERGSLVAERLPAVW
ncbi:hypothetical protein [Streptomyces sp. PTD5-9]|uniref:hypothetical protein n=1 Tax=Streptomyces sp. PTD5-9 TaxID=3120150 RepID=UPI0030091934